MIYENHHGRDATSRNGSDRRSGCRGFPHRSVLYFCNSDFTKSISSWCVTRSFLSITIFNTLSKSFLQQSYFMMPFLGKSSTVMITNLTLLITCLESPQVIVAEIFAIPFSKLNTLSWILTLEFGTELTTKNTRPSNDDSSIIKKPRFVLFRNEHDNSPRIIDNFDSSSLLSAVANPPSTKINATISLKINVFIQDKIIKNHSSHTIFL